MVLNTQKQEDLGYERQTFKTKSWNWKWEKKHWLLVISIACLALWWFGSQMTELSLIKPMIDRLPLIGSLCFALEAIIKLSV